MRSYAQLLTPPTTKEWATLRVWAAGLRDEALTSEEQKRKARTLARILDSCQNLRERRPQLSEQLWQSALLLADKIALPKETQGQPLPGPLGP
jgi:hypothetical protein